MYGFTTHFVKGYVEVMWKGFLRAFAAYLVSNNLIQIKLWYLPDTKDFTAFVWWLTKLLIMMVIKALTRIRYEVCIELSKC